MTATTIRAHLVARRLRPVLAAAALLALSGCVVGPGYYGYGAPAYPAYAAAYPVAPAYPAYGYVAPPVGVVIGGGGWGYGWGHGWGGGYWHR